jgi:AraC family transcriptional regulator
VSERSSSLTTIDLTQEKSHQQVLSKLSNNYYQRFASDQFVIEHHRHPAHEIQHCSVIQAGMVLNLGGTYHADQWIDGNFHNHRFDRGDFIIFPAEISHRVIWDRSIEFLMVGFDSSSIKQTILELNDCEKQKNYSNCELKIVPQDKLQDPLVYQIGLALKTELQVNGTVNNLYTESMINALLVHLLRRYSSSPYAPPEITNGLSKLKLNRVLEYIHDNLLQNITLAELGAIAQLSPHYFASLFKQSTGLAPHQYVIHQRLNKAKELLRKTNLSITDIAAQAGFSSQSHLTTICRKHLSVTPKKYRAMFQSEDH